MSSFMAEFYEKTLVFALWPEYVRVILSKDEASVRSRIVLGALILLWSPVTLAVIAFDLGVFSVHQLLSRTPAR